MSSIEYLIKALKKARKAKSLSQRDLGKKAKIPQSHLSKIESDKVDLHVSSLVELARILDLELMLVPRQLINTVLALQRPDRGVQVPMYRLEPDEEDENE